MADKSRIAELEKENASLRLQIEAVQKGNGVLDKYPSGFVIPLGLDAPPDLKTLQLNEALSENSELAAECERLRKLNEALESRYSYLERKHAKCKPFIEDALKKYTAAKKSVRQWRAYLDRMYTIPSDSKSNTRHHDQISEMSLKKEVTADLDATPRPSHARHLQAGGTDHDTSGEIDVVSPGPPNISSMPAENNQPHRSSSGTNSNQVMRRISSSQSTEVESNNSEGNHAPCELSSPQSGSEPTVVSTQVVKRKRSNSQRNMPPPVRIKKETESPDAAIEISSSGHDDSTDGRRPSARRESSDLDVLVATMKTPRTDRRIRDPEQRASSQELPLPLMTLRETSSISGVDAQDARNDEKTFIKAEGPDSLKLTPDHQERALSSLSVNVPTKFKGKGSKITLRQQSEDSANRIAMVSEDGDPGQTQGEVEKPTKTHPDRRLLSLLAEPSPENHVVLKRRLFGTSHQSATNRQTPTNNKQTKPKPPSPKHARPTPGKDPITPRSHRSGITTKTQPAQSTAQNRSHRSLPAMTASPPPPRPEDEPLRLRPMTSLHLDDFKINPKYMNSDFAFADTLRRGDDKRCMSSCTKPECCGNAFLQAVQIGGLPSSSSKTDADVLQTFLGPEWQDLMASYPPSKRTDLLMQARAHAYAHEFGKHRMAFARPTTPPGFWRTDMPTTQEEAEDRAQAREMVQAKIAERWREAMRSGGKWLFRDE